MLPFLLLVGLWLLLWPSVSDSPGARRLRGFTAAAVVIALIGAAISLLSLYDRALAAGWMRFYWYRLVDVAVPLGLALLSVRWFVQRKMRVALAAVTAVAAFHAVDCVVLKLFSDPPFAERQVDGAAWRSACLWAIGQPQRPLFPRQPRADKLRNYGDWVDVCRWVSDPKHTPPDARFLIPRMAYTFKWYAGRGEVVNWKETPQDAASLVGLVEADPGHLCHRQPAAAGKVLHVAGRRRGPEAAGVGEEVRGRLSRYASQRADVAAAGEYKNDRSCV